MSGRDDRRGARNRASTEGDANARIRDAAARLEGAVRDLAAGASDNVAEHLDRVSRRLAREAELRRGRVAGEDDAWTTDQPRPRRRRRLYRSTRERWLCGVCGGIAEYYGVEVLIVRLIAVAGLLFLTTPTLITYIVAVFIIKKEPSGEPVSERPVRVEAPAPQEGSAGRQLREVRSSFERVEQRLRRIEGHVTLRQLRTAPRTGKDGKTVGATLVVARLGETHAAGFPTRATARPCGRDRVAPTGRSDLESR